MLTGPTFQAKVLSCSGVFVQRKQQKYHLPLKTKDEDTLSIQEKDITKCDNYFITKCDKSLLQNGVRFFIIKCDSFVTESDSKYKMRQLSQTAMLIAKCFGT